MLRPILNRSQERGTRLVYLCSKHTKAMRRVTISYLIMHPKTLQTLALLILCCTTLGCERRNGNAPQRSSQSTSGPFNSTKVTTRSPLEEIASIGSDQSDAALETHHFFQEIMGTMFRVQLIAYNKQVAQSAARAAFNEVRRIEHLVSSWREKSEIGQLNARAGGRAACCSGTH